MSTDDMSVIKRDGSLEPVAFDKIMARIKTLTQPPFSPLTDIHYSELCIKVINQMYDKISTSKIDELTAEQCATMSANNPDYGVLAARIAISSHQKNTKESFVEVQSELKKMGLLSPEYIWVLSDFKNNFDEMLVHERDYLIDYFGFKTLEKGYLQKGERPQHMWMRVAIQVNLKDYVPLGLGARKRASLDASFCDASASEGAEDHAPKLLKRIQQTYDLMSQKFYTHATPTLYNSGTKCPQLSSCFLLAMEEDSIDGIYNTLHDAALISKYSGGIGLSVHNIRAKGSRIHSINGKTEGIVPMLRVFNNTARYVNQGGKRNGSIAVYLEPWHADIQDFLEMKRPHGGDDNMKGLDLFYALWIPDLFMERVKRGEKWSLFCPNEAKGLADVWGTKFVELYTQYETAGLARMTIDARDLWHQILDSQMETGTPYILFKDTANRKSNQQNLGTIRSSNLCCEVIEYSDKDETAVCNLASIGLPAFCGLNGVFDYIKLHEVVKTIVRNLDNVIDSNFYPTEKTRRSNMRHRPIGIGVQGLADVFVLAGVPFASERAAAINHDIFETIYYAALEASCELAQERGKYESFEGSPASKGILQFDMWNGEPTVPRDPSLKTIDNSTIPHSTMFNWDTLKQKIAKYGLRNSLLVAPMPTASTSQILGYNECIEPFTSNIYSRKTLAGNYMIVNKYLVRELMSLGMWNSEIKNSIIAHDGSVQHLTQLPENVREKYRTVWEIPMRKIIDMAADRGQFICQSQSMNLWMKDPTYQKLTSMHFYAWEKGLKTGIYYLRTRSGYQAQKFTVEPTKKTESDDTCTLCSA